MANKQKQKKQYKFKTKGKKVDAFAKKEWYNIQAPSVFPVRTVGHTVVNKTHANKLAKDSLMHRVFNVSLGDLSKESEDFAFRQFRLRVEHVEGNSCLTNFYGMDLTRNRLRSLIKRWQSLVEVSHDVKTSDGYVLRLFLIGFTKPQANQIKSTCYAQTAQIRQIRKKMIEVMDKELNKLSLREIVLRLIPGSIGPVVQRECNIIFPMREVCVRKVKVLRVPKLDAAAVMEAHATASKKKTDFGAGIRKEADAEEEARA